MLPSQWVRERTRFLDVTESYFDARTTESSETVLLHFLGSETVYRVPRAFGDESQMVGRYTNDMTILLM